MQFVETLERRAEEERESEIFRRHASSLSKSHGLSQGAGKAFRRGEIYLRQGRSCKQGHKARFYVVVCQANVNLSRGCNIS